MADEDQQAKIERLQERGCAAAGAPTLSRPQALIDNEMRECTLCERSCRWDVIYSKFFGFSAGCPELKK